MREFPKGWNWIELFFQARMAFFFLTKSPVLISEIEFFFFFFVLFGFIVFFGWKNQRKWVSEIATSCWVATRHYESENGQTRKREEKGKRFEFMENDFDYNLHHKCVTQYN